MSNTTLRTACLESNRRVLVVDDNPAIHEDISKSLAQQSSGFEELDALDAVLFGGEQVRKDEGFEVTSAFQGSEAIELVTRHAQSAQVVASAAVNPSDTAQRAARART